MGYTWLTLIYNEQIVLKKKKEREIGQNAKKKKKKEKKRNLMNEMPISDFENL